MAETEAPTDPEREARRAIWAAVIGAVMLMLGLVLVLTRFVIYVGAWPEVRPVYFEGIGVVMTLMGIIALSAGIIMSQVFKHEAMYPP